MIWSIWPVNFNPKFYHIDVRSSSYNNDFFFQPLFFVLEKNWATLFYSQDFWETFCFIKKTETLFLFKKKLNRHSFGKKKTLHIRKSFRLQKLKLIFFFRIYLCRRKSHSLFFILLVIISINKKFSRQRNASARLLFKHTEF